MSEDPLSNTLGSVAPEKLEEMRDSFRQLEKSGSKQLAAASKFEAGLDKVVDVMLVLVLKFGRATTMLLVMGVVLVICLVALIVSVAQVTILRTQVRDLLDRQEEFARSQERIEKATSETQQQVTTTSQKIEKTQATVENVAETTPKVEVDARTGKAKLVVQGEVKTKPVKAKPVKETPPQTTPPVSSDSRPKYEINLE